MENKNIELIREFIKALNDGKTGEEITCFYDSAAVQIEYPNLLTKSVTKRTLSDIHEASLKGKQVISKQNTDIINIYATGESVVIEAIWTGILAIPLGKLGVGEEVKAYFAQFYEFKNGKIITQKNYDCFESFL